MADTYRLPLGAPHMFGRILRTLRPSRASSRGQSLVELALILPVFLLLLASALDLGRVYYSQISLANAAKEGALEAAQNPASFDSTKACSDPGNRVVCVVTNEAKGSAVNGRAGRHQPGLYAQPLSGDPGDRRCRQP